MRSDKETAPGTEVSTETGAEIRSPESTSLLAPALDYWRSNRDRFLDGLKTFLRIPSISTLPEHRKNVAQAASYLGNELRSMGMNHVEIVAGKGNENPLVIADWLNEPGKPTLLLYGHYDVQPVDPLDQWISPPFEPQVRKGKIFARGASDDKGQVFIMLKVLEGFLKVGKRLPINVKVLFEGDEESDGSHIERYVRENHEKLTASAAVVLDSGVFAPGLPTITTGLRGIVCAEVQCRGAHQDLHSGQYGGAAPNAAEELAKIIAKLKTPGGRIRIPGFYDGIISPSKLELAAWQALPFNQGQFLKHEIGAPALTGDKRFSVLHRLFARPTLEVNGIAGGFAGEGFKTIIPAVASAKVSMRLVPGMNPDKVARAFKRMIKKLTPACVKTDVNISWASPAMVVDTGDPFVQAAAQALALAFAKPTVYVRDGGSIPIAGTFSSELGIPVIITGFTLPDCNMHAPNESLDLAHFYQGIEAFGTYVSLLAEQS